MIEFRPWTRQGRSSTALITKLKSTFPNAEFVASTFDSCFEELTAAKFTLPDVKAEIPALYNPILQQKFLGAFNKPDVMLPFARNYIDLRLLGFGNHLTSAAQIILQKLDHIGSFRVRGKPGSVGLFMLGAADPTLSLLPITSPIIFSHSVLNMFCENH